MGFDGGGEPATEKVFQGDTPHGVPEEILRERDS
jgi:hypothetical protein